MVVTATIGWTTAVPAADSLGTAVGVTPAASGELAGSRVTIIQGSQLFEGQVLTTGPQGEIQIVFTDDTHMVIGPQSILVIERYLLRSPGSAGSFAVNALGGTFRFITGNSPHSAYSIATPAGTIAVRGTEFDFSYNARDRRMNVVLYFGGVTVCSTVGDCADIDTACSVGIVGESGRAESPESERERIAAIRANFPYARGQGHLGDDFQVENTTACLVESERAALAPGVLAAPAPPGQPTPGPPPPPEPPPPPAAGHNNNGLGNGGEGGEGPAETGNPGGNPNGGGGNPNAGGGNPNAGGGNPNAGGGNPNGGGPPAAA